MDTTRRQFLGSAAGVLGAATVALAAESKPQGWKCGLGLNGFMSSGQRYKKTYPLWEILDFATREGFDGIELVEGWPMGGYPAPEETGRIDALKRLYDQYGFQCYTIQTGGGAAYAAEGEARRTWLNDFRRKAQFAKQIGSEFIGHWPGGGLNGNENVDQAITHLAASYREAAKICADLGMYLSFEIEPPFIFNTLDHLQRILELADHPACKTNYDPSHFDLMSGSQGRPEAMLKQLGVEHIGHVHLTDTDGTLFAGTSKHLACGEGHCDIPASLQMLWEGGYRGWIMIDAWMIEEVYHAARQGKQAIDVMYNRVKS